MSEIDLSSLVNPGSSEILHLQRELEEIEMEQKAGKWIYTGDPADETQITIFNEHVRKRVKRAIEILATLRRSNTGPAKPKATARKKTAPVTSAALSDLEAELG